MSWSNNKEQSSYHKTNVIGLKYDLSIKIYIYIYIYIYLVEYEFHLAQLIKSLIVK